MTDGTVAVNLYRNIRHKSVARIVVVDLPINSNGVSPENNCSSPNLPVRKPSENLLFADLIAVGGLSLSRPGIIGQSGDQQVALWLGKEFGGFGAIRENLPDDERERHWDQSLD